MRDANLVQHATSPAGGEWPDEPVYEFTAEQVEALEATRASLNFTPEESEQILRRGASTIEWIASAETLEEQQRRGAQAWAEDVERPRATRRIATARRAKTRPMATRGPRRVNGSSGRPRAQATRSSARSGDGPDSDSDSDPDGSAPGWRWAQPVGGWPR